MWKCNTELDGLIPYSKPKMETDAKLLSDNEEEEEEPDKKGGLQEKISVQFEIFTLLYK